MNAPTDNSGVEYCSEPSWCGWCGGACRCDSAWQDKGGCQYCDGHCHGGCREGGAA